MDDRQAELERLRALVGPSEPSYEALRRDRDESMRVARQALAEVGALRGDIVDLRVQVSRARQDQEYRQVAAAMNPVQRAAYRARRRWATSVRPRLAILVRRARRVLAR
ncbi:hypothetical protein [Ilumatobacter sp.]|uniref:hypothetical protein n=1 Tax=Ilumatobacter sp. TaxID=1967498 RepID=UPI003B527CB0